MGGRGHHAAQVEVRLGGVGGAVSDWAAVRDKRQRGSGGRSVVAAGGSERQMGREAVGRAARIGSEVDGRGRWRVCGVLGGCCISERLRGEEGLSGHSRSGSGGGGRRTGATCEE